MTSALRDRGLGTAIPAPTVGGGDTARFVRLVVGAAWAYLGAGALAALSDRQILVAVVWVGLPTILAIHTARAERSRGSQWGGGAGARLLCVR